MEVTNTVPYHKVDLILTSTHKEVVMLHITW